MKLYAPAYYKEFSCIADRCTHSCCIGWEIDVDEDTFAFYQSLDGEYAQHIRASIESGAQPHFALAAHDRCPHLDSHGLCRIIKAYGKDALCEICREHPRFYHDTLHGKEAGLGLCCEEACRIVLGSDAFADMILLGEATGGSVMQDFDATAPRAQIFAWLLDAALPYPQKLQRLQDCFGVSPASLDDAAWCSLLQDLEYLDPAHRALFACYSCNVTAPVHAEPMLTRALAYFVYRHCSAAYDQFDFCANLGLALFFERLLCSLICTGHDVYDAARILSEELEYSEDNTDTIRSVFEEVLS